MVSDITEARYRQRAGLPLEPRHVEAIRKHDSKYAINKISVHVDRKSIEEWKAEARATGRSLSAYIVERVDHTRRPSLVEAQLRQDLATLETQNRALSGVIASLTKRQAELETQLFKMQDEMVRALAGRPKVPETQGPGQRAPQL